MRVLFLSQRPAHHATDFSSLSLCSKSNHGGKHFSARICSLDGLVSKLARCESRFGGSYLGGPIRLQVQYDMIESCTHDDVEASDVRHQIANFQFLSFSGFLYSVRRTV